MRRNRLISLIFILYYIAIYKYVFCIKSDGLKLITSIKLKFPDAYIDEEEQIKLIRNPRRVPGSRRHLRVGDAHQVANYFLSGGPQKGHAHFMKERDCESNENKHDAHSIASNKNRINTDLPEKQNSSNTQSDSVVGAPQAEAKPTLADNGVLDSIIRPAIDTLSRIPHTMGNELLTSILHPNLHPHITALQKIPSTLMKTATDPVVSLMRARTELRKALRPVRRKNSIRPPIVGLAPRNLRNNVPSSNTIYPHFLLSHRQPTGYIVKYVPHNEPTIPPSKFDSTQQPSNCINDHLNGGTNVGSPTIEDELTGEEQDGNDSEQ